MTSLQCLKICIIIERLRYPDSGLRVRVSPFCLPIFAVVSNFTRNFYPFPRGKPWSTRKRQTGTGVFCLLFLGRLNSTNFQHLTQINNAHMLVKVTVAMLVFQFKRILTILALLAGTPTWPPWLLLSFGPWGMSANAL